MNSDNCSRISGAAPRNQPSTASQDSIRRPQGLPVSSSLAFRKFARSIIRLLPAKKAILKGGALLRPEFRSALSFRFFSALAATCPNLPDGFVTNLGIDKKFRIYVSSADLTAIFGAPRLNIAERSSLELMLALFEDADCFVDVGSYLGLYVYYLRLSNPEPKPIYFFEPDPSHFKHIESTLASNKIEAIGFHAAMAARSGAAIFYQNRTHDMSGSLVRENWIADLIEPIEVSTISFADFVAERGLRNVCVKVDVEGAEEQFWEGAKGAVESVSSMIIEMLSPAIQKNLPRRITEESGLHAYYINDYRLVHSTSGEFTYVHPFYNWLFHREAPATLRRKLAGTKYQVL